VTYAYEHHKHQVLRIGRTVAEWRMVVDALRIGGGIEATRLANDLEAQLPKPKHIQERA
jgi:hypothetical protein